MKWLDDKVRSLVDMLWSAHALTLNERCKAVEDRMELLSASLLDTRKFVVAKINDEVSASNGDTDDKIAGLHETLLEKMAKGNGFVRSDKLADLMKKVSRLENLKEKMEVRRDTQELIDRRDQLKDKASDLDRQGKGYVEVVNEIKVIDWVLGKEQ